MSQSPAVEYRRLNRLMWEGRLPRASVYWIDDETMPTNFGLTMWDEDFSLPVIFLNASNKRWLKVLVHECIHIAEPSLSHGRLFDALVETYWRRAKNELRRMK